MRPGGVCVDGARVCRPACSRECTSGGRVVRGTAPDSVYVWFLEVTKSLLGGLECAGPCRPCCSGHPAGLGGVPPCLTAGVRGGGPQSRPGLFSAVLTTRAAAHDEITGRAPFYLQSPSGVWLIEVFGILVAFWHSIRRFRFRSWPSFISASAQWTSAWKIPSEQF